MAEIRPDFTQMDGVEVLLYLIKHEPFFWVLLGIGFVALGFSLWFDRYEEHNNNRIVSDQSENLYR